MYKYVAQIYLRWCGSTQEAEQEAIFFMSNDAAEPPNNGTVITIDVLPDVVICMVNCLHYLNCGVIPRNSSTCH